MTELRRAIVLSVVPADAERQAALTAAAYHPGDIEGCRTALQSLGLAPSESAVGRDPVTRATRGVS